MRRKLLCAACAAMLLLSACGSGNDSDAKKNETSAAEETESTAAADNELPDDDLTTDDSDMTPAIWQVTGDDGAVVTLVGSMHALKESDYPIPDIMSAAFEDSEILAVEADLAQGESVTFQSALLADMYYDDPKENLKDHISQEAYESLAAYYEEYSMDLSDYNNMKPWAVGNIAENLPLQYSGLSADMGIDNYLMGLARESGKEIYEVEGLEFQMDLLMNFSDDIYDMLFRGYKNKTKENQVKLLKDTHDAWIKGDLGAIENLDADEMEATEADAAVMQEYTDLFINNRNKVMADAAENFINGDKNVFFLVGAAHYTGEKGIIAILESDGYKVEKIEY